MKQPRILPVIFFCLLMLVAMTCRAESGALERMEQNKDFESGCGCSVVDSKDRFLVVTELEAMDTQGKISYPPAIVKIAGKRRELSFVSSTEKNAAAKLGDRFTRVYEKDDIRLVLNFKTTFICPPKSEECEVTRYSVDGTLTIGGKPTKLSGLKGDCGC